MFEKHAKNKKPNMEKKSESKITRTVIHSFPRPLFSNK